MTGLLVGSTALSVFLHLRESDRFHTAFEEAVRKIVQAVAREHAPGGVFGPRSNPLIELEQFVPRYEFGPNGVSIRLEKRTYLLDDPQLFPEVDVIPPEAIEATLLDNFLVPSQVARNESVPRAMLIASAVILAGVGVVGLLVGRMTRPVHRLTERMELVAAGDLTARMDSPDRPGRDEFDKMAVAFNSMLESLREKRELERQIFRAERLSSMGTLAAGVAHDIRNPLNTIGLTLGHLGEQFAPEGEEHRRRFQAHLDDVRGELDRLNDLVKDFLSLAHPDRGEKTPCDLAELVEDTTRLFRKEAESKDVAVELDLADVPPVVVHPQQIRGAITNVVVNALASMEESGGHLQVGLAVRTAGGVSSYSALASSDQAREVVLSVRDTGVGIEPEDLERVFLPYFTTREDGTGLGLPVARTAVEANGGRLEITSRAGAGTTVELIFDEATPEPALDASEEEFA